MTNPFKFRPREVPEGEPAPDAWADNWLSNFMAWFSLTLLSSWCDTPEHWTQRVTRYLHTSCPCCLVWRGLSLGFLVGLACGALLLVVA